MNDSTKKEPLTIARPSRLELTKTVESGKVKQNFQHGRCKTVTVEVRKTRTFTSNDGGKMVEMKMRPVSGAGGEIAVRQAHRCRGRRASDRRRSGSLRARMPRARPARRRGACRRPRASCRRRHFPAMDSRQEAAQGRSSSKKTRAKTPHRRQALRISSSRSASRSGQGHQSYRDGARRRRSARRAHGGQALQDETAPRATKRAATPARSP